MDKFVERLAMFLAYVAGAILLIVMVLTFIDVVGREFGAPLTFAVEATKHGMGIVVAFGLAITTLRGGHISVDLLSTRILNGAHSDDLIAVDRHIGRPSYRTGSIDNLATADHEIMHDPQCLKAPAARDNGACF